ncbi:urea carboxylase-associated family protein [Thiomicrorhabdus sp. 6S2-11]|uniref:Urea carboxylase-associated family protein n=1 Tax=Thiomicrorhabdus marina TaxID=2818442 RepID=A0ABS3Q459_9GAMM|nr:urea amidolyase associated protein UAAP2 [Thiomicrorhabdus marina]MBO1927125.1 urea carboxylase-associated family protein [Thiomicrorhabdus marina]
MTKPEFDENRIVYREVVKAGDPWMHEVKAGQYFRIVDLEGNQAVDTLFYKADDQAERYSATDTIREQGNIYLTTGSVLRSNLGNPMLTIVDDTCGRHDTIGGACSAESNTVRYSIDKRHMHSCRDSFLKALSKCECNHGKAMTKDELSSNINFFMNVPVSPDGHLDFDDGISAPGRYVEMQADMDVLVLISNCPQLNNPCNGYNPTPVELIVWE